MNNFLTTNQIARLLGITTFSATRLIRREQLGIKLGRRVYVKEQDWLDYVESKRQNRGD